MEEVAKDIFLITEKGSYGAMKPPVNCYVIAGDDGLAYDAGYGNAQAVRDYVKQFRAIERRCTGMQGGFNVRRILPSHAHPDHFSGLMPLKKELGLSILLTPEMHAIIRSRKAYRESYRFEEGGIDKKRSAAVEWIRNRTVRPAVSNMYEHLYGTEFIPGPDEIIEPESGIMINGREWRVLHSPGHSSDHITLYDPERGILFAGDNILRSITTWLGPPKSDLSAYCASLRRIMELPKLELILSAHGSPITGPRERVREILEWREERTRQVLEILRRESPRALTIRGLLGFLYEKESWFKYRIAEGWVMVTLDHLVREGLVTKSSSAGRAVFTAVT
jgi:glyoxylase-like metal-dependent hydrolase (beta-lactamase superfamily II)